MNLFEQAIQQMLLGNAAQARQLCEQILYPENVEPKALHLLGLIAFQEKRHTEAIDYLSQVLKLQPENADAYFNQGQILLMTQQYVLAEKAFASTLQLVPEMGQAQLGLGQALAYLGQSDAALLHLKKVIAKRDVLPADDVALAFLHKGMLYCAQGAHQKALHCFEQAINLNTWLVLAHYGKAHALRALGRLDEAESSIKPLFALDDQFAPAYFLFGRLLEKSHQYTEALRCFDRAIFLVPEFSDAIDARDRILQVLGLHNPARIDKAARG